MTGHGRHGRHGGPNGRPNDDEVRHHDRPERRGLGGSYRPRWVVLGGMVMETGRRQNLDVWENRSRDQRRNAKGREASRQMAAGEIGGFTAATGGAIHAPNHGLDRHRERPERRVLGGSYRPRRMVLGAVMAGGHGDRP